MSLRYLTAGESHGPALTGILEGMPAGVSVKEEDFKKLLKKRWAGYGRGKRKAIENDQVEVLSGVINGLTIGSPISLIIRNNDFENSKEFMAPFSCTKENKIKILKPGHADFPGLKKYALNDIRPIRERASARETAIRTALSVIPRNFLSELGIKIIGFVTELGGIPADFKSRTTYEDLEQKVAESGDEFLTPDLNIIDEWKKIIDKAADENRSLGGVVEIRVYDLPVGLGSHTHCDRRLEGILSAALMSLPAVKAVEFGYGIRLAKTQDKLIDEFRLDDQKNITRTYNFAGGIEGGMTNGQPLIIKCFMKPIPGNQVSESVDFEQLEVVKTEHYRSDTQAVQALAVVAESVLSIEISSILLETLGGADLNTVKKRFEALK